MSTSKLNIIGAAFGLLGQEPPTSLGESSEKKVQTCSFIYDMYYKTFLCDHAWHFARTATELVQVSNAPTIVNFTYAYQIPSGFLRLYKLDPIVDYKVFGTYLYTNAAPNPTGTNPTLYYTEYKQEGVLPEWYISYLIEAFTALFAMPVTQNSTLLQIWRESASQRRDQATAIDESQQPNELIINNPIAASKYIGSLGT